MKAKRFWIVVLAMITSLVFGLFAACGTKEEPQKDPTGLTINSATTATIEVGEPYTLIYSSKGTVTVTVSGGTYDEDSHEFTATEAGSYTITVKAVEEGKAETSLTVTITVEAGPDKAALKTLLANAEAYVKGDYTGESWNEFASAKADAKDFAEASGKTQTEIDSVKAALEEAIEGLVPVAIEKAAITDGNFTYNTDTYKAIDYNNMDEILADIEELNADTTIILKSVYTAKMTEILAKLDAKVKLALVSELRNNAAMIVETLQTYTISAESEDGVAYAWKVNGADVAATAEYEFTPAAFDTLYEIECTVSKGENTNTKKINVSFVEVDYVVNNRFVNNINVTNNVINVTSALGWGDEEGKKVTIPDLTLTGNFTVWFDLTFTQANNDPNVMALFFNNENGDSVTNWVAVREQDNKLEVAVGGNLEDKPLVDMPANSVNLNNTMHFMATRTIKDGRSYIYAYLLDDYGNVLVENTAQGLSKDYTGPVKLGIQAENAHFTVANLAVGKDDAYMSTCALNKALALSNGFVATDYTETTWNALVEAKAAAEAATTQADLATAVRAIVEATDALEAATLVKATIDADTQNITFGGKTYEADLYENVAEIVAELNTLNADTTITLNSDYAAKANTILAKLVSKVVLNIAGAPEKNVTYLNMLPTFNMTASGTDGATYVWKVDGNSVSTEATYAFTPTEYKSYEIVCTATKGEYYTTETYNVTFANAPFEAHKGGVQIDGSAVKVTEGYGWDDNKGKKATASDWTLSGNFTVYFDLTFNNQNNVNVFALFLLKANGDVNNDWVAITSQNNQLEVSCLEQKAYKVMTEGATAIGTKTSYKVTREIIDGRAYITAYQLDANGNPVTTNDGTQDGGNRVSSDYTGAVVLGIQSEWALFVVENFRVNSEAQINNKVALRALVKSTESIIKTDYTEAVVTELDAKIAAANEVLNNADAQKAAIEEAYVALETAIAAIKPENYVAVTKAVVDGETITYSITNLTLNKSELYNFDAIATRVNELNSSDDYAANSAYTTALTEALNWADYKISLSTLSTDGLKDNTNYIAQYKGKYDIEVKTNTKDVTYTWTVNGTPVEAGNYYALEPVSGTTYTIVIVLQKTGEGYEAETYTLKLENVTFMTADIKTPMADRVTIKEEGGFSSTTGIGWGDMEGRKVLYDDLVFNGSFSVTMDLTYDQNGGGANVATIHLLNADTLSPSFGGDWAFVGYGCICLHENPVRLETNWSGTGKKQSSDGGFESVANAMNAAADLLKVGNTFTVKLTCYKNASNQLQLMYSLWNGTQWIDFARDEWTGDLGGGFIVGINIENVAITASNVRYELLEGTDNYIAGTVKSRANLSAALVEYANVDPIGYTNAADFVAAYNAGWALMSNNSATVDYEAAAKNIVDAYNALVEREVVVSVEGLDKAYSVYRGFTSFEAKFAEGVEATEVKWTYQLDGTEASTTDGVLALTAGEYTHVKLNFKVGEKIYEYRYQNFKVEALTLVSRTDKVTVNGGTVTVDDGAGWGQKDQLVIDGVKTQEFELTFNVKHNGTPGGGYQVMCINLFGEDMRPVFGYQREDVGNRAQLGFDGNGDWININNTEATGEAYDHIFGETTKFSIKQTVNAEGKFFITFAVYNADGSVIAETTREFIRWYSSTTEIRFTFENIDLTLSDFAIMYN